MNRELLSRWLNPPTRELTGAQWWCRWRLIMRAIYEADDTGALSKITQYKARQWNGGGSSEGTGRQLQLLHEEGFFQTTGEITVVVPYADLFMCPRCKATNRQAERRGRGSDIFRPEEQPCRAD